MSARSAAKLPPDCCVPLFGDSVTTPSTSRGPEADYAVVVGDGVAAAVAVAREDPQGAVGGLDDVPEATRLVLQELLLAHDCAALIQVEPVEPLATQGRHKEVALPLRDRTSLENLYATRGGLARGEECGYRVDVSVALTTLALDLGPAVVASRDYTIDLVVGVLAELARVELAVCVPRQALHVAVAVGVERVARELVVSGHLSFGGEAQDLTSQGVGVLGTRTIARVAGAHVQVAVRSEGDPPAIVVGVDGDAGQDGFGPLALSEPHDAVIRVRRVVGVYQTVPLVVRRERQPQKPSLPHASRGQSLQLLYVARSIHREEPTAVALCHERLAARSEHQIPGSLKARGNDARLDLDRSGVGRGALQVRGARVLGWRRPALGQLGLPPFALGLRRLARRFLLHAAATASRREDQDDEERDDEVGRKTPIYDFRLGVRMNCAVRIWT